MAKQQTYTLQRDHHEYTVQIIEGRPMRWNCYGKCWPDVTQCLIWVDGIFRCKAEVVRHERDEHNPDFAIALVCKKAFKEARFWKELRMEFWNDIKFPQPHKQITIMVDYETGGLDAHTIAYNAIVKDHNFNEKSIQLAKDFDIYDGTDTREDREGK